MSRFEEGKKVKQMLKRSTFATLLQHLFAVIFLRKQTLATLRPVNEMKFKVIQNIVQLLSLMVTVVSGEV